MDPETHNQPEERQTIDADNRRDAVRKLGRFAAYAAPFTVLALTKKADAATGSGPRPLGRH
jgi:hypothetical protein